MGQIGVWLAAASYGETKIKFDKKGNPQSNMSEEVQKTAATFFEQFPIDASYRKQLDEAFQEIDPTLAPKTKLGKLLIDASNSDFVMGNGRKYLKKFYEQMLLSDVNISKKKWYDIAINLAASTGFHLPYCKEEFQPKLDKFVA